MSMPGFNPAAQRRALEAAKDAGAPLSVLAALQGNQIAKLMTTVLNSSPLLDFEFTEQQLDPDSAEDGWTLVVRWQRPTDDDIAKAASMGLPSVDDIPSPVAMSKPAPKPEPPPD